MQPTNNIDQEEINKFDHLSAHWWDPQGELKTLHEINPLRLNYINGKVPLANKKVLDIGCGGGILSESMAKLGANVTGIDMSEQALTIAKLHQQESGTQIEYVLTTAEKLAEEQPAQFDVIVCMEMLEHVPDPTSIIRSAVRLVKPQGHVFFSTLNRTVKSYLTAIVGAEYILKMLPRNTHDFAKFIQPSELAAWARNANLDVRDITGITYNILTRNYQLATDVSVNYLMYFTKAQR